VSNRIDARLAFAILGRMTYRIVVTVCAIAIALVFAVNCSSNKKTVDAPPGGSGTDAAIDSPGSGTPDAAIDARGAGSGLTCGSATCATGDVCCVGSAGASSCIGSGSSCTGFTFVCDGPGDCGSGQDCCFSVAAGGTSCETGGTCAIKACNGSADCSAPAGMCCPIGSAGFSACFAHCP
jgi:hypothetical protein